jgi:hypothetical protein
MFSNIKKRVKDLLRPFLGRVLPLTTHLERGFSLFNDRVFAKDHYSDIPGSISEIKERATLYFSRLRVQEGDNLLGYRFSTSVFRPTLYSLISVLMIKHLLGIQDKWERQELALLKSFQDDDGLFKDPVIACEKAETEDWWGWRHLTLHALMALALFGTPASKELKHLKQFQEPGRFKAHLDSRDWGDRAAWTSNELQNLGVMIQYARDFQGHGELQGMMDFLFDYLDSKQDPTTGLFGNRFSAPRERSLGIQAGYHFWLLYFFDKRPIHHVERIIDQLLLSQNILGGYGVKLNSSACEDIDSIDPLVRFARTSEYRHSDIQTSLQKAFRFFLSNLNRDGSWVFRRHEPLLMVHSELYSRANEGNLFFSWFRLLAFSYCLKGLATIPAGFEFPGNFSWVPGHQFL